MLTAFALHLIRWYQRHLSPRKGYACAYRVVYGGSGCSGVGYRLIRRYGAVSGCLLLRKRFAYCCFAAAERQTALARHRELGQYQRGDCVPDCGDVDMCLDVADCFGLGDDICCDAWGNRQATQPKKQKRTT